MMLFQVSYERFIEEIRHEKMEPGDINQLECEDLGTLVAYYLYSLTRPIAFVFVIKKDKMTDIQKMELAPISKQSIRIRDSVELTAISDALQKIEQNLKVIPQIAKAQEQTQATANLAIDLAQNPNRNEE